VGKSSLLKAIGWGLVVGFPKNLRCLYVDQLEGVDLQQPCLEVVLQADAAAQRAQRESAALEAALEGGDGAEIARALRTLRLQRLRDEAAEAQQTAARRSGERGLAARQALVAAEARLADAEAQLGAPVGDQELHGALGAAQDLLTELFDQLSLREPEEAEGQARAILTGLGFSQEQQEAPLGQLSGAYSGAAGWVVAAHAAALALAARQKYCVAQAREGSHKPSASGAGPAGGRRLLTMPTRLGGCGASALLLHLASLLPLRTTGGQCYIEKSCTNNGTRPGRGAQGSLGSAPASAAPLTRASQQRAALASQLPS
jgi:hypothetical protein